MKTPCGSIVLVLLFFLVCMSLMAHMTFRTVALMHDAAFSRASYQQKMALTMAMARYARHVCQQNVAVLLDSNVVAPAFFSLHFPIWPPHQTAATHRGVVQVRVHKNTISVEATLFRAASSTMPVCTIEESLVPVREGAAPKVRLQVATWRIKNMQS